MEYYRDRIRGAAEEGQCDTCGEPLYDGDRVIRSRDDEELYCSRVCLPVPAGGLVSRGSAGYLLKAT